ncbi:hypothetical protein [Cytobacillus sp. IB215665]|uniref:hypothetical protein n=1 Tax=Cytobacillus sp. IB215665 TaxID=3097357 RepID=UPI002A18607C|nr:hypothetical protein [Cytobacillus sp. IB215665]MDX8367376.1 hypothetical protein [Cytobacillus sp. IB215665]
MEVISTRKNYGVVMESKIFFLMNVVVTILFPFIFQKFGNIMANINFYLIFVFFIFVILFLRFYYGGRSISVYEITQQEVKAIIKEVLDHLQIVYEEKEDDVDDKYIFDLVNDRAKVVMSWHPLRGHKRTTINISIKRWWRISRHEEVLQDMLLKLKANRQKKWYWEKHTLSFIVLLIYIVFVINIIAKINS